MKLRSLIGARAGEIRDYSPIAARGALASGVAARLDDGLDRYRVATQVVSTSTTVGLPTGYAPKVTQSRRKG